MVRNLEENNRVKAIRVKDIINLIDDSVIKGMEEYVFKCLHTDNNIVLSNQLFKLATIGNYLRKVRDELNEQ